MTQKSDDSEDFQLWIVCVSILVGLLLGWFFWHEPSVTVSSDCVVDHIESAMNESLEKGYFLHGIVNIDNTVWAVIDWYFRYSIGPNPARVTLSHQVSSVLRQCGNKGGD